MPRFEISPRGPSTLRSFLVAVLSLAALAGCNAGVTSVGPNTVVNGWSIGDLGGCAQPGACAKLIDAARAGLDAREPGHPAVVTATYHGEGLYPNLDGDLGQIFRSGAGGFTGVVLFLLADGTYRAIGVGQLPPHLGERPLTFDYGPERRDEHTEHQPPAPTI